MNDSFSLSSQGMSCPSTSTSFSSASSAYDPFTPSSRRSTPNELSLEFEGHCASFAGSHPLDLTPPSTATSKYMFGPVPIKSEAEQMPFQEMLPMTPVKKLEGMATEYDHMMEMNMAHQHPVGSLTPSNSFGMYTVSPETAMGATSFMMTPTQSISGSEVAENTSSWPCVNESPISFFNQRNPAPQEMELFEMDRQSISPLNRYQLQGPVSPNQMRAHRKMMVHEIQRKTTELQRAQIRASRKRTGRPDAAPVDVVRRAMNKCNYPNCQKAFRRNEHLKRHKQT